MKLLRWWPLILAMAVIACQAGVARDPDLRSRYDDLNRHYQLLKRSGTDVTGVDELIRAIERAKHKDDTAEIEALLTQFQTRLVALEPLNPKSTPDSRNPFPDNSATPALNSEIKSLYTIFQHLDDLPEYRELLRAKARAGAIDSRGAASRNKSRFSDVAAQRDAGWLVLAGLNQEEPKRLETALHAIDYAFARQEPDGNFRNNLGVPAFKAINADVFFLQAFGRMYWLVKDSPYGPRYTRRLEAFFPKLRQAMAWLRGNTGELRDQDGRTANRLAFDALAFILNGKALRDDALVAIGTGFLNEVLNLQRPDGVFLEKGGQDSSYQAVTLLNLATILPYLPEQQLRQRLITTMVRGYDWLKSRILANGEVLAIGNTRTGQGQEFFFGKAKDINYAEVAMALFCWSVIASDRQALALAKNVVSFARENQRF